ncbi:cystathionine gamma-lyase-like isoform X2 [Oscarella lobularis]|uniref:cystathionine gamma-lyase-like isoform X2 n=1 Tax=Oscarella lobularis TaxID=121494 RepID=UPI0033139AF6
MAAPPKEDDYGFATKAVHCSQSPSQWNSRAIVPPITLSDTFEQDVPDVPQEFEYSRMNNPTRLILENVIAALEGAKFCVALGSGQAAINIVGNAFLTPGDHVVCTQDAYSGTVLYLSDILIPKGIQVDFIDMTNVDNVLPSLKPTTKMVWIETPSNPALKITDIKAVTDVVTAYAQSKGINILCVADNTFATPYCQLPLTLGVDIIVHSVSKYMAGHFDGIIGAVVVDDVALHEKLKYYQSYGGAIPSPFNCYMATRGIKTLPLRMDKQMSNAQAIALYLQKQPEVDFVSYPGHDIAKKQMTGGYSGMVAFALFGGHSDASDFLMHLKLFKVAISLGGVNSLVEISAVMSKRRVSKKLKEQANLTETLIRLSLGIETQQDLINDLEQAFGAIREAKNKS